MIFVENSATYKLEAAEEDEEERVARLRRNASPQHVAIKYIYENLNLLASIGVKQPQDKMNTVINPLAKTKIYLRMNRTKENETLYFLPEASLLIICTSEKVLHYIHGTTAEFLYNKLKCDVEKKKDCKPMKKMLEYFHRTIDEASSRPFDSMAGLEEIIDKLD
jgi:hypothetical protein